MVKLQFNISTIWNAVLKAIGVSTKIYFDLKETTQHLTCV